MTDSPASPRVVAAPPASASARAATLDDVAVLMPAFNGQADVERTLASFQEDAPVHVLLVDDGSTPPIVAPTLPNLSIEILRMPQNVGIERALRHAVSAMRRASMPVI
jgi:glycosyltransferase involved in cell wall biosynthesis